MGEDKDEDFRRTVVCSKYYSKYKYFNLEFDYCSFVIVKIAIVWCREYSYNCRKFLWSWPFIHFESFGLGLMCSNHRNDFIFIKESTSEFTSKKIRASSYLIDLNYPFTKSTFIINWISPHKITKKTIFWDFSKSINFSNIIELYYHIFTVFSSCEIPPWTARNFLLIKQANGNWSNISIVIS